MKFVWNSSLPRSGSTLLQNIIAQCPSNHVTPTSGMAELLVYVRNKWVDIKEFQAQGINDCAPAMASAMRGMIEGYYRSHASKVIWDKSRGWVGYARMLDEIFGEKQQIVACVRDVREIVTSFELLWRQNQITRKDGTGPALIEGVSLEGRVRHLLAMDSVVGQSIAMLRDCLLTDPDRLLVIPYNTLCDHPQRTIDQLNDYLGLPQFTVDANAVKQVTEENDSAWGIRGLHDVRPQIARRPDRWPTVLPTRLAMMLEAEYEDINSLAAGVA